jgi:hypothetical protein
MGIKARIHQCSQRDDEESCEVAEPRPSGLYWPFTAVTRVQIPSGTPNPSIVSGKDGEIRVRTGRVAAILLVISCDPESATCSLAWPPTANLAACIQLNMNGLRCSAEMASIWHLFWLLARISR